LEKAIMSVKSLARLRRKLVWLPVILAAIAVFVSWHVVKQRQTFAQRTHCVGNLVHIRMAKDACQKALGLADGVPVPKEALDRSLAELGGGSLSAYKCPSGGTYHIGDVGTLPECTRTNLCYTWELQKTALWLNRRSWKHSLNP
jgi:hypothetical protein